MNIISTIIVTYNRKNELLRCIQAVLRQTKKPTSLIIIDNDSSDGSFEYIYAALFGDGVLSITKGQLVEWSYDEINIYYKKMERNEGGAGGFYAGMEIADKILKSDFFWLMDDDGYPSDDCLEKQLTLIAEYDYVMPVSIDLDDNKKMSWATKKRNGVKTIFYRELYESWGEIINYVIPFNGALLTRKCIEKVGYINKDFFIWGDDYEHYWRCKKAGFNPITFMQAIFYHPAQRIALVPIFFNLYKLPYVESKLRMICLIRNSTYIYLHYDKKTKIVLKFIMYSWLFLITRRFDINGYKLYLRSMADAFQNNFTRHREYL
ncbi:putative glycosyl transferase [Spirochaetia bacterium]|nr:putative glycosyl transferase [Spirochaetia bacterium]